MKEHYKGKKIKERKDGEQKKVNVEEWVVPAPGG